MPEPYIPRAVHDIEILRAEMVGDIEAFDGVEFCPIEQFAWCSQCLFGSYCDGTADKSDLIELLLEEKYITKGQALDLTLSMK